MSLLQKIKTMQVQARKDRNEVEATFLTTLYSEAANWGLNDGKRESTDAEVIATIRKFMKNCEEIASLAEGTAAAAASKVEYVTLSYLLPAQLGGDEIRDIIRSLTSHGNNRGETLGSIMGYFKKLYAGLYDGKLLSVIAKGRLDELSAEVNMVRGNNK